MNGPGLIPIVFRPLGRGLGRPLRHHVAGLRRHAALDENPGGRGAADGRAINLPSVLLENHHLGIRDLAFRECDVVGIDGEKGRRPTAGVVHTEAVQFDITASGVNEDHFLARTLGRSRTLKGHFLDPNVLLSLHAEKHPRGWLKQLHKIAPRSGEPAP